MPSPRSPPNATAHRPSPPSPSAPSPALPRPAPADAPHTHPHPNPHSHPHAAPAPYPSATEVLPRLFISDLHTAEDPAALRVLGITHVLSALPGPVRLPPALALTRHQVPVHDTPFAELAAHLPGCTAFIDAALRDPAARVLVHCAMGASRSVSVVCAWLVARAGLEPDAAVRFVRERRRGADPNPGFVMQLHEYAASLRAGAGAA